MFEYMTVQEAAEFWGISVRRVQKVTLRFFKTVMNYLFQTI